jgi:hypothetical protein
MFWKMVYLLVYKNCTNILKWLAASIFKVAQVVSFSEKSMLIGIEIPLF